MRRVLINEEFEELMPRYLNFIKGIVDSDELPINVSRESIQQLKMLKVMSRKLVRRAIEMIRKLAEEKKDADDDDDSGEEETSSDDGEDNKKDIKEEEHELDEEEAKKKEEKKNQYIEFWKEFGKNIKLGIIEDSNNRARLAKVARFYSSRNAS